MRTSRLLVFGVSIVTIILLCSIVSADCNFFCRLKNVLTGNVAQEPVANIQADLSWSRWTGVGASYITAFHHCYCNCGGNPTGSTLSCASDGRTLYLYGEGQCVNSITIGGCVCTSGYYSVHGDQYPATYDCQTDYDEPIGQTPTRYCVDGQPSKVFVKHHDRGCWSNLCHDDTSNLVVETCTGGKTCSSGGVCVLSCTPGWICSGQSRYYQNPDCSLGATEACPYGCSGGICNLPSCTAGWVCKDSLTKQYQNADCNFNQITDCGTNTTVTRSCINNAVHETYTAKGCASGACYNTPKDNLIENCVYGCAGDACLTPTCTDSDGSNSRNKGYVNASGTITYDTCSGNTLLEQVCSGIARIEVPVLCPYNCLNGACSEPTCPAGWVCRDLTTKQYQNADCSTINVTGCPYGCSGAGVCSLPTCTAGWECNLTMKHYKNTDCSFTNATNCINGCSAGVCLAPASANQTCIDSDQNNARNKGYVNISGVIYNDTCSTGNAVLEQTCSGNSKVEVPVNCPLGCKDGACLQASACTAAWECRDATTKQYKNIDCSITNVTGCPTSCSNGACAELLAPSSQNYILEEFDDYISYEETDISAGKGAVVTFEIQKTATIKEEHTITVKTANPATKTVVLTISSAKSIDVTFNAVGQKRLIDVNRDGSNDIEITFMGFEGDKVKLVFRKLAVCGNAACEATENSTACCKDCACAAGTCTSKGCSSPAPTFGKIALFVILPIIIVAIIIASFFIMRKLIRNAEQRGSRRYSSKKKRR